MRVGLLVYALDKPLSGISRYAVELARALTAMTGAPEILLLAAGPVGPLEGLGLPVIALPGCSRLPGLLSIGQGLLPALSRRHRLDIVHDTTGVTPFGMGGGGARRVVTVHDVIPLSFSGVSTRLDSLIYRRWLPWALPRVDQVITVSAHSASDISHFLSVPPARIVVTPLAAAQAYAPIAAESVTAVRVRLGLPERYLLYLGSVEERKNLRRVLKALALLREQGSAPRLVVTGALKWQYAGILETLERLRLHDLVTFTGYVGEADLPALYAGTLALVFPSLYEGFGLPVLEAMACGAPVITSTSASLPEVAGQAALLVDPYSVEAIAAAMATVAESSALRETLRTAGLAQAARFTWTRTAERTHAAYEAVLRR